MDGLVVELVKSIAQVLSIGLGATQCDQIWRIAPLSKAFGNFN